MVGQADLLASHVKRETETGHLSVARFGEHVLHHLCDAVKVSLACWPLDYNTVRRLPFINYLDAFDNSNAVLVKHVSKLLLLRLSASRQPCQ